MTYGHNSGTPSASLELAIFLVIRFFNSISPGNLPSFSLENTFKRNKDLEQVMKN
ncbi:uncharacterized protein DS421_15g521900 [Arachis hypogaea]|nr:uncharacterized protein DS421_15g521900 [Arachis hypogaea]